MLHKNKRILWLLCHKTLMEYEVPLLRSLGFEVFVPKIIPKTDEFRSCGTDFSFDKSLTIPDHVLRVLNSCHFYQRKWPRDAVFYMNRYFGTAFIMPMEGFRESVTNFEGNLLMRAFGLINTASYHKHLEGFYGEQVYCWINAVRHRFWFAAGYEQLKECEPPLLAERSLYLPIGLSPAFWRNANTWTGTERQLLFFCPSIVKNHYHAAVYKQFKREFGDFPHLIAGKQDVPVNDPHVLGFVSDQELVDLYKSCSLLLYPSRERRHVHYSPVEANVVGMPIVFYDDCLLARICNRKVQGAVSSVAEARNLIKAILKGEGDLATSLKKDQQGIAYYFSDEYCKMVWQKSLAAIGLGEAHGKASVPHTLADETKRVLFYPWAHGKKTLPRWKGDAFPPPSRSEIHLAEEFADYQATFEQGIDFRRPGYPTFIKYAIGISFLEEWGRWSDGRKVTLTLANPLKGKFKLVLVGGAFGENIKRPMPVRIGHLRQKVTFSSPPHRAEILTLEFALRRPATTIEFTIPLPTTPGRDDRQVGIGFVHLRVEPFTQGGNSRTQTE
jgi:glycosyltransferase involved in cell wall biosynthesis